MVLKWTLLLLALTASLSTTAANDCVFEDSFYFGYSCWLANARFLEEGDDFVITGEHLEGRTDADVESFLDDWNNTLRSIPPQITERFPNLDLLYLYSVGLQELNADAFVNCERLEYIYLYWNNITTIPSGVWNHCTNLVYIDLYSNSIREIDEGAFTGLDNILAFDFSNNLLTTIQSDLFESQTNLIEVYFYRNLIDTIESGAFRNLESLLAIDIGNNRLTEFADDVFQNSPLLQYLYIDYNQLETIPRLPALDSLYLLWLTANRITEVPDDIFANVPNLEVIDFERNQVAIVRSEPFVSLERLRVLYFEQNGVTAVDTEILERIPSLQSLWLTGNRCVNRNFYNVRLQDVPILLDRCFYNFFETELTHECTFSNDDDFGYTCVVSDIRYLNFNDKFLLDGDHLEGLTNTAVYGLRITSSNFLRVPPSVFSSFPNLRFVQISGVSEINEETFEVCPPLTVLDLSGNNIRRLPRQSFTNCNSIENLILDNNPIVAVQPSNNNLFRVYIRNLSMRNNVCVSGAFTNLWYSEDPAEFNQCFGFWFLTL